MPSSPASVEERAAEQAAEHADHDRAEAAEVPAAAGHRPGRARRRRTRRRSSRAGPIGRDATELLGEALGERVELVVQRRAADGRRTARSAPRSAAARPATRRRRPTSSSSSAPGASSRPSVGSAPGVGNPADRGVARRGGVGAAVEHPREHPAVLAVAGPEELAVGALAEPVHVEELRQLARRRPARRSRSQCAK